VGIRWLEHSKHARDTIGLSRFNLLSPTSSSMVFFVLGISSWGFTIEEFRESLAGDSTVLSYRALGFYLWADHSTLRFSKVSIDGSFNLPSTGAHASLYIPRKAWGIQVSFGSNLGLLRRVLVIPCS